MEVVFECRDPRGAEQRDLAVRRTRFVMRRLRDLVQRARVQLSDINGPRGGIDKRCQIELTTTTGSGTLVISAVSGDWRSALDEALARAARTLTRACQRGRQVARPRPGLLATDL